MTLLFSLCFAVHSLHAVLTHRLPVGGDLPTRQSNAAMLIQVPLFLAACVIAIRSGVFGRDLFFPPAIVAGLVLGHAVFGLSLLAVHRVLADAWALFLDLRALAGFLKECPSLIMKCAVLSFTEEIIYRAAAQTLLVQTTGRPLLAIVAVALIFALTHRHFYLNGLSEGAEFLLFSLLLGALYHFTGSLILVTMIHAVRNLEIAHVDFVAQCHEHDADEAAAWRAFEQKYGYQGP